MRDLLAYMAYYGTIFSPYVVLAAIVLTASLFYRVQDPAAVKTLFAGTLALDGIAALFLIFIECAPGGCGRNLLTNLVVPMVLPVAATVPLLMVQLRLRRSGARLSTRASLGLASLVAVTAVMPWLMVATLYLADRPA